MSGLFNYPFLCLAFGLGFYSLFTYPPVEAESSPSRVVPETQPPAEEKPDLETFIHQRMRDLVPAKHRFMAGTIAQAIIKESRAYNIDPVVLMAVIYIESRFKPKAVGQKGEIGLMQLRPSTALWMLSRGLIEGIDREHTHKTITQALFDPAINIKFGAAYLAHMQSRFPESETLYLAAYNMGEGTVRSLLKRGREPRRYTNLVFSVYESLKTAAADDQKMPRTTASTFDLR